MKFALIAAAAAAMLLAPAASAAGLSSCIQMSKQTAEALASAQPGRATDEARSLANAARTFCATSQYAQGVARYTKALQLLGKV